VLRRESCGALARQMGLVGEDGAQALWALVEEVRGRVAGA
jgi:hypothetical protein